jgi:5,5'-dehydrodivanillate O-demethylase
MAEQYEHQTPQMTGSRWDVLTQTGAGTPMGELLRRYWWPIAGASELAKPGTLPVRLMGENLVLYKDLAGNWGLIDRHCRHRRADLSYGYVEECGLRCNYHGWLYGADGRVLAMPYEDVAHPDSRLKDEIRIKAYPVEERGGLIWAYLGPEPRPLVPDWEFFSWPNGFRQIVKAEIPCNWFQCQENSIDPVHFEWTHSNWSVRLADRTGPYTAQHVKVDFSEFDWGFQYKRIRTDTDELDRLWTVGRVCLWPNGLFTGNHVEFRVPVDDENTLSVMWHFSRVPHEQEPYVQNSIPTWQGPIMDPETGRWVTTHVMNQDFVTWVGQGRIADRGLEFLAPSDRGIVMIRRRFLDDIEAVKQGRDPKAIVRDPEVNQAIALPVAERESFIGGFSRDHIARNPLARRGLEGYIFQTGQPAEVRAAFLAAMGFSEEEATANPQPYDALAPAGR